jgi:uncharacterized membrane protein
VPTLRLSHLSPAEKCAYVLADNKLAILAGWDREILAIELQSLIDLDFKVELTLWVKGLVATTIVAVIMHWLATPVPGIGIALPVFMPAVITAIVAVVLSRRERQEAAPLAYIAGGLGTLIGADITNLDKVRGLGAPVASIGGAGTFDGIFLTGILAVLLASFYAPPRTIQMG